MISSLVSTYTSSQVPFLVLNRAFVFMKYHNVSANNLREWNRDDAEAYKSNIATVLHKFLTNNYDTNEK